jgi:putative transposase
MDEFESLSHSKWECKYHVVFIPKCRRKTLYGQLRPPLGEVFRKLALQKESPEFGKLIWPISVLSFGPPGVLHHQVLGEDC